MAVDIEVKRARGRRAQERFRKARPERVAATQAAYYQKNKEAILNYKATDQYRRRQKQPGFDFSVYEQRLAEQGNKCAICRVELVERGLASNCACADHCHKTQRQRGVLCRKCNSMIGLASEREEVLLSAIEYLRRWKP